MKIKNQLRKVCRRVLRLASFLLLSAILVGCSTREAEAIDGKILKDREGNYYLVTAVFGDKLTIEKLDIEKYESF